MSAEAIAIVVAPEGATGPLEAMVDWLAEGGVEVHVVEDVPTAALECVV